MSQEKGTQRVTKYSKHKAVNNDTSSSQGVPTSDRPTEVRPDSIVTQASSMDKDGNVLDRTETVVTPQDPTLKFFGDVAAGGKNTLEGYAAIVDPEAWSEEGGEYANRELRDKSVVSGAFDTLTGKHTSDEFFGEVGWRAQNEPGKLVGELAVEAPLFFLNPLKVVRGAQAGSKVASNVLKAKLGASAIKAKTKLGASAIKAADGPTRGQVVHANKMAKFNKSVGDVNKLNKEIDVAKSKVEMTPEQLAARDKMRYWLAREEADSGISVKDMAKQGGAKVENTAPSRSGGFVEKYTKASNPAEPRSHVDLFYQKLNEGGPLELSNKGGGFKDPATAVFGHGAAGINKDKYPKSFLGIGFKDPKTGLPLDGKTIPIQNQAILPSKTIDMISTKSIRGSGKENKMFRAAVFKINRKEKDEARIAIENLRKSDDAWLAKAEIELLKKWKAGAPPRESFMMNTNKEFFPRDRFLTGAGIGALGVGGLGIFGLGGRKNDKSN